MTKWGDDSSNKESEANAKAKTTRINNWSDNCSLLVVEHWLDHFVSTSQSTKYVQKTKTEEIFIFRTKQRNLNFVSIFLYYFWVNRVWKQTKEPERSQSLLSHILFDLTICFDRLSNSGFARTHARTNTTASSRTQSTIIVFVLSINFNVIFIAFWYEKLYVVSSSLEQNFHFSVEKLEIEDSTKKKNVLKISTTDSVDNFSIEK